MQALIDGDLVAYRCSASADTEPLDIAIIRADRLMRDLLEQTGASSYRCFLSGIENFRKEICPEYKANRKDIIPPRWLQQCKEYLITAWKAEIQENIEADDALGINQTENTIIVSLDKDLLQIPGKHYRWEIGTAKWTKPAEWRDISVFDGLRNFYISSLVGDKSDNIIGVNGIGPVKAQRALEPCETEQEMFNVCRNLYNDDHRYIKNLKLLWILRKEGEVYCPINRGLMPALKPSSSQSFDPGADAGLLSGQH